MNAPAPRSWLDRPLDGWSYFWWGAGLMTFKYNYDRAIAYFCYHRSWYFWNYIRPHGFASLDSIPPDEYSFYAILVATSLPFLLIGVYLTLLRLRSTGLPLASCLLFFVPAINLIFFLALCVVPTRGPTPARPVERGWESLLPRSAFGSAILSVLIVGTCSVALVCLSTEVLQNYGWGLFMGEPFALGMVSALIYAWPERRSFWSCLGVALLTTAFVGLCLFALAVEGFICLLMAAPIGMFLALIGGGVGFMIADLHHHRMRPTQILLILLAVPFTMGMEAGSDEAAPELHVTTSVIINAPPEQVWPNVISFSTIPPERDWILHTGIAYPTRARIVGQGVGAVRHCIFNTGEFIEPIKVWDENRLLKFSVAEQPEPMEEMSPYPHLRTTHLRGYFQSQEGELRLTPLPGGRTLLQGTTWYTNRIWPSEYWQLWSDLVIHHIHLRVLNHIKHLSESSNPTST